MSGLFYAVAILAVCAVIHWYITNDSVYLDKPTTGLLAMRDPGTIKKRDGKKWKLSPFRRHKE